MKLLALDPINPAGETTADLPSQPKNIYSLANP